MSYAVSEYFQGNPDFNGDEEEDHVNRILTIRNWTKINPTTSDITLARQLVIDVTIQNLDWFFTRKIAEEIKDRAENGVLSYL